MQNPNWNNPHSGETTAKNDDLENPYDKNNPHNGKITLRNVDIIVLFSFTLLGGLFNETETVYANIATPGSPTDPDWGSNIYNPANPLSPNNPANQEHDSKRHKTKTKKEQSKDKDELPEPVQFILGCLTIGGLLFAFYYIIFSVAKNDKL